MDILLLPAVSAAEIARCAALADEIWHQHYASILSPEQIDYMVERFQSAPAMSRQIAEEGYRYVRVLCDGEEAGFFGYTHTGDELFLSKLYLRAAYRGRGLARRALVFLEGELVHGRITLTVNRYNTNSIAAYRALGFSVIREQCSDIGAGFVMDDFVMEKRI